MGRNSGESSGVTPYDFGGKWEPSAHELSRRAARKKRNRKNALIASVSSILVLGTLAILVVTSPGWKLLSETFFAWAYGVEVLPKIILGFGTNVVLTLIAGTSVAILGLSLALIRTSKSPALTPFRLLATAYVDLFRG
ncbi:MAG: amino acid ABC transporter permease, partial [Candidatus Nanopelagicaceae bacterium]|nr:amino acid ABC transporter permease [Candidatus Nanopelagicaceae bacterium]